MSHPSSHEFNPSNDPRFSFSDEDCESFKKLLIEEYERSAKEESDYYLARHPLPTVLYTNEGKILKGSDWFFLFVLSGVVLWVILSLL